MIRIPITSLLIDKARQEGILAIVQARLGSTRLPGKVLKQILNKPLLEYVVERASHSQLISRLLVATTTSSKDDPIAEFCAEKQIPCYRGSELDVLDRFYEAAKAYRYKHIVRITGDCPLIEPEIIDKVIARYLECSSCDYAANTLERTYPRGLDVEIFSFKNLEIAAREAHLPEEREHVTPYFYHHPERFKLLSVKGDQDYSAHRWTVDTQEDFDLVSRFIQELYLKNPQFTMEDLLEQSRKHPEWKQLNAHIEQKKV